MNILSTGGAGQVRTHTSVSKSGVGLTRNDSALVELMRLESPGGVVEVHDLLARMTQQNTGSWEVHASLRISDANGVIVELSDRSTNGVAWQFGNGDTLEDLAIDYRTSAPLVGKDFISVEGTVRHYTSTSYTNSINLSWSLEAFA